MSVETSLDARRAGKRMAGIATAAAYGLAVWAIGAATMWLTFWLASPTTGFAARAVVAPAAAYLASMVYFRRREALSPGAAAAVFAAVALVSDGIVAFAGGARVFDPARSVLGTWLPAALVLLVTWVTAIGVAQPQGPGSVERFER